MFEGFRKFLTEVSQGGKHPAHFEPTDYRLAAAALLVHAAAIDGNISQLERDALHAVIKRRFDLDEAQTDALVEEATEAEHERRSISIISPACLTMRSTRMDAGASSR